MPVGLLTVAFLETPVNYKIVVPALLLALLPLTVRAQQTPTGLSYKDTAVALTTQSSCPTASAANPFLKGLTLDNTANASTAVGYCLIQPGQTSCTAAIGTPPTTTLAGATWQFWPGGSAPQNGICMVAAGSVTITVREGQ